MEVLKKKAATNSPEMNPPKGTGVRSERGAGGQRALQDQHGTDLRANLPGRLVFPGGTNAPGKPHAEIKMKLK